MHDDYGRLLASKQFVDVEFIIGKENVVISGHIAIIAARSVWLRERIRRAKADCEKKAKVSENNLLFETLYRIGALLQIHEKSYNSMCLG